ncbi:uncharacterized protein METZ01_LOCUS199052 [marine metagenome]|uniref:Uncharacterized protein n=1 Tax=marine metagenome TaxID=408172 RepID=A0A382E670_9ZZZZ
MCARTQTCWSEAMGTGDPLRAKGCSLV